jgi:hypothetical protein
MTGGIVTVNGGKVNSLYSYGTVGCSLEGLAIFYDLQVFAVVLWEL